MTSTPRRARVRQPGHLKARERRNSQSRITDLDYDETLTVDASGRQAVVLSGGGLESTKNGIELKLGRGLRIVDGALTVDLGLGQDVALGRGLVLQADGTFSLEPSAAGTKVANRLQLAIGGDAVVELTDNSGGTSGGDTIAAVGSVSDAADAIATLAAKLNETIDSLTTGGTL